MGNQAKLVVLGLIIATSILTVIWTIDFAFAKNKNFQFEISECSVQRNSTYEKSGSCPDPGSERAVDKSMVEPQAKVDSVSETDKTETPQTKVDSSFAETEPGDETDKNKYNFDELHISASEEEVDKGSETKLIPATLPKNLEPIDPFGPAIR